MSLRSVFHEFILKVNISYGRIPVKALRLMLVAFVAFVSVLPIAAQEAERDNWSSMYYINVPIEKIYPHNLGYMVLYRKSGIELGRAYIPQAWFSEAGGKGEIIRIASGTLWPYMSVYYNQGQFSHVRLYIRRDRAHPSWGMLPQGTRIDERFNIEELNLEF